MTIYQQPNIKKTIDTVTAHVLANRPVLLSDVKTLAPYFSFGPEVTDPLI